MGTGTQPVIAHTAESDRAIATITAAFVDDPVIRWVFRDPYTYLTYWPKVVNAFAGAAFDRGTADSVSDCGGIALWLPPDVGPDDEQMAEITAEAVPAAEQDAVFSFMTQMGEFHPTEQHWYLPVIGVDVTQRGRGYGSALMRHAAERCDRDGLLAYLEATSPRNKSLYERHGFEEIGLIQSGDSPPMWPMVRRPQPRHHR